TASYSGDATGIYGSFTVNAASGEWLYTLDNANHQNLAAGETHTETFTVTVTDDQGRTEAHTAALPVQATNESRVLTSSTQSRSVTEDATLRATRHATPTRRASDLTASYSGDATGIYGSFTVNAASGEWLYTLDNANHQNLAAGETHTETFTVTVTDDQG